jgi:hypothetical protein
MEKKDEPRRSIFGCETCASLPQKKDLEKSPEMPDIAGLEEIFRGQDGDRHGHILSLLKRCLICETTYRHVYWIDTEDAVISGGPSIGHYLERLNPVRLKEVLFKNGLQAELTALESRMPALIQECRSALRKHPVPSTWLDYVVETLRDHYMATDDWPGLEEDLLRHADPEIAYMTAFHLMFKAGFMPFVQTRIESFRACLKEIADIDDPKLGKKWGRVLKEAQDCVVFF